MANKEYIQDTYDTDNADPYEKKAFMGNKDCLLKKDIAGYKYISWREDGLGHVEITLYEYELEAMLNRLKQYKGE